MGRPIGARLTDVVMAGKHLLCMPLRRWLLLAALAAASVAQGADNLQRVRNPSVNAAALRPLLLIASRSDAPTQLRLIHRFFNQHIEFVTDQRAWGQVDYWASPLEALQHGQGDCEDYAIGKYFSLLSAGMSAARLRLVYVRAQLDDGAAQAPMVLAYYPPEGVEPLIPDNLVDDILPASRRLESDPLASVFSFNSQGLWQGVGPVSAGNPASRLTCWRKLMAKARSEGFP